MQPYAASKKGAEALAHSYHHLYDIDVTIVRYFTVYGPAGRPDLAMFRFVQWILEGQPIRINGDGNQSRGFINLGGHEVITINQLVEMVEDLTGKKAVVQHGPPNLADMRTNQADVSKAKELLNWNPQVTLREGIGNLINWYNAEREWAKEVLTP